jgi:ribosomal protein S18 acetylase RimI-like enzyme
MDLRLRPVTQAEYAQWISATEEAYTAGIAASGSMPANAARAKARADTVRSLPDGRATKGQLIFRAIAGEEPVGWLWLAVPGSQGDLTMAWVYDISVDEAFRGRGYGRQIMLLAEKEAQVRGMASIGLNVFGQNVVARSLYESLGYEVTSQQMKKGL